MKNLKILSLSLLFLMAIVGCKKAPVQEEKQQEATIQKESGLDKEYKATRSTEHVDWSRNAVIYEVNVRQYTEEGTFNAFAEHLPRLKKLGIDILWFMPITPISEKNRKGTLGSYYAVQDYKKVNPEFGTEEDFKKVVDKAHELGMYVILDWVANHSGWDNPWIEKNPEWYTKDDKGNIISPEQDWTDVADLNYDNKELRAAMTDALEYWVKEFDVDGYRCDVAGSVPVDFWNDVRKKLDAIKPVFMLAEAWEPQLIEDAFDMAYGWDFHHTMNEVAKGEKTAAALIENFQKDTGRYSKDSYLMHFITNHDENSWSGTEYERMGDGVNAFAVLSFTVPDMPLLYSGQEAGLNKRLEFFEKDEIKWDDTSLEPFYQKLTALKHSSKTLRAGEQGGELMVLTADNDKVLAFVREKEDEKIIVLLNFTDKEQQVKFDDEKLAGNYKEYFTDKATKLEAKQAMTLKPWAYQLYVK